MRIIIIEDEVLAAERLQRLIAQYDPSIQVAAYLPSVEKAILWLNQNPQPELAFVDIQLSDGLCFEIFEAASIRCPVIFTTSFEQYALEAFGVNSVAYLLKPVKYGQLVKSFHKLDELKQTFMQAPSGDSGQVSLLTKQAYKSRFLVKNGLQIKAIKTDEIAYFFSDEKMSFLVSYQQQKFPVDFSLEEIEATLNPDFFFRISRKYIVHVDAIKEINPYFKGRLKVTLLPSVAGGIVVSSERTPQFKSWLDH
ncbi:Transcriptional regulatory protein YpdB [Dyadobacter sp. CECT 9623]|uniref:Transcriptional regulatory protein YpdB n=1 Tax=Dyadobacter linearis TaxID=2823330 RepID=A0ABN7REQ6_9BACT|nr:LytTR family DNA-binding domain-containing protein [Dyadobacter sp. CECT 9623]CAG5074622.1 Transcriptional regulatory protein YpdB [Dyadobacter sp. CECT 9623]